MGQNNLAGAWGEALAAAYLQKKKYKIIAARFHCRFGEIDLIAANKNHIVFAEIKLRKSDTFAQAIEFVDQHKQNRLRSTAAFYLSTAETDLIPRFDVIEIYAPEGTATKKPVIRHLESAFE